MAAECPGGWHEEAEKLCAEEDLMAAVGDRSIFSLDDINLDDIFLDLKDADISGLGPDNSSQSTLFPSGNLHSSAPESGAMGVCDAAAGAVLPEGLLCDDIDVTQLEWLSNFCEESYSSDGLDFVPCNTGGGITFPHIAGDHDRDNKLKMAHAGGGPDDAGHKELKFRTSSPISVLEHGGLIVGVPPPTSFSTTTTSSSTSSLSSPTSSSCSGIGGGDSGTKMRMAAPRSPPEPVIIPARSRSKRPRPASFSPRPPVIIPPLSSCEAATFSSGTAPLSSDEHDNFEQLTHADHLENGESAGASINNKKKKKKKALLPATADGEEDAAVSSPLAPPVRKCMHCEVTKTPQWRAGPMGPKTLCNACGVRYKSGRLFPEYRPAASPTFEAAQHSNSHKKVVEMRNKATQDSPAAKPGGRRQDVASKGCELLEYIRRREWCGADQHRIVSE